ncbi:MAG: ABC transporter permease [Nitrospinae bacterium]|nr:ABC transporter permease [Nitrospinota bacterium]
MSALGDTLARLFRRRDREVWGEPPLRPIAAPSHRVQDEPEPNGGYTAFGPRRPHVPALALAMGAACFVAMAALVDAVSQEAGQRYDTGERGSFFLLFPGAKAEQAPNARQMEGFKRDVTGIRWLSPVYVKTATVKTGPFQGEATIIGVTGDYFSISGANAESGRLLTDLDGAMNHAVASASLAQAVNGGVKPGQVLELDGKPFMALGVANPDRLYTLPMPETRAIYVHALVFEKLWPGHPARLALGAVFPGFQTGAGAYGVRNLMRAAIGDTPVTVSHGDEELAELKRDSRSLSIALGAVGAVALLAGGVGMLTYFLGQVAIRKPEIVVRSVFGARPIDLEVRFGLKAFLITAAAGFSGIAAGLLAAQWVCLKEDWVFVFPAFTVQVAAALTVALGAAMAAYPALCAAQVDAVSFLRAVQLGRRGSTVK